MKNLRNGFGFDWIAGRAGTVDWFNSTWRELHGPASGRWILGFFERRPSGGTGTFAVATTRDGPHDPDGDTDDGADFE